MPSFLAILLLVSLGLLTTGSRFYRLRRSRTITALHSGGWLALLVGMMLGPVGTGLIDEQTVRSCMPLLQIGLGWIGFMVGLQLQKQILRCVPRELWKLSACDAAASIALITGACALLFWLAPPADATTRGMTIAAITLAAACVGWAMETRSQGFSEHPEHTNAALMIRAAGGIAAAIAITIHGLTVPFIGVEGAHASATLLRGSLLLGLAVAAAVAAALLGAFGLAQAGRQRDQQLTVFLGMLAVVAGLATQTGTGTLLASMIAGAIVANLPGSGLRAFERFVLRSEHAVAVIFSLLAGVLMTMIANWTPMLLALLIFAFRITCKPSLIAALLPSVRRDSRHTPAAHHARRLAAIASMRQSPIALALIVSIVLVWPSPATQATLIALVIAGILSELAARLAHHRLAARPDQRPLKPLKLEQP